MVYRCPLLNILTNRSGDHRDQLYWCSARLSKETDSSNGRKVYAKYEPDQQGPGRWLVSIISGKLPDKLIAYSSPSPKTQRAVAWSIPIVNHTWLEDCFVAWK